ncbi:MAG: DUF1559 domain-containing protein [Planctomycetia bacterium]|nr:DUF1559 domain-containing protein [Planctomycetia bacterium]
MTELDDEYASPAGNGNGNGAGRAAPRGTPPDKGWHPLVIAFVVVLFTFGAIALLMPSLDGIGLHQASEKAQCSNNLKQIGMALHNYLSREGTFPPAYFIDSHGRPMHSWRVILLPYFEQGVIDPEVAKSYDFDEPWDGPSNRKLADKMPAVYQCPAEKPAQAHTTNYVAVVGDETFSPFAAARAVADITDGLSNTIAIVEVGAAGVPWVAPRDLDFAQLDFRVNSATGYGIGSRHKGGANVLLADGSVRFLEAATPPESLRALLTIADGEATK